MHIEPEKNGEKREAGAMGAYYTPGDMESLNRGLETLDSAAYAETIIRALQRWVEDRDIPPAECRAFLRDVGKQITVQLIAAETLPLEGPVGEMQNYIREHACEGISLRQTAEHFFVSPTHFSHLFKQKTGMKYQDYVTRVRMDRACALLSVTDWPVVDICGMVGYTDLHYFTTLFERVTGVKPSEYRRRHAAQNT